MQRLLCSTALIDSAKLRTGRISTQKEWDQLANAASVLMDAPLYIDDTPGVSVSEIRSKCRRLKAEQGLDIIMIDYLQLMQAKSAARSGDNRQQEISEISRSLKSLARELNVPVIALSQLSEASKRVRTTGRSSPTSVNPDLWNRMPIWSASFTAKRTTTVKSRMMTRERMKRKSSWPRTETVRSTL